MNFNVDNAALHYTKTIFENISFSITDREKVGLVGDNGCGKSALLKCIMGLEDLSAGSIHKSRNLRVGYMEQEVPESLHNTTLSQVIEAAIPQEELAFSGYKIDMFLEMFNVPGKVASRPVSELSGGWKKVALLGRAVMDDPELLLLDEPTNHLDIQKIVELEKWLQESVQTACLIISHDREFLDNCTKRTLILRGAQIHDFSYSYSPARKLLAERDRASLIQRKNQEKEAQRLSKSAHNLKIRGVDNYSEALKNKAKQMQKRADELKENFTSIYIPPERKVLLNPSDTHAKTLITLNDVTLRSPDGKALFFIEKWEIKKGERIVILGENGSGKSQLLQRLVRDYHQSQKSLPTEGIRFTPSIRMGYIDQQLSFLPWEDSLEDFFQHHFDLDVNTTISKLVQAGFSYHDQTKKIGSLSFGERVRVLFLTLHLKTPNFYIMDEPANHLDLDGQDRLEFEILKNQSNCILVSHDRRMIKNLGTTFYLIDQGRFIQVDSPDALGRQWGESSTDKQSRVLSTG